MTQYYHIILSYYNQSQVRQIIESDSEELVDAFYKELAFGTGGMRGVLGVGTNRINKYTLGKATQGLSNYLKRRHPGKNLSAVIAYDCRHQSDTLGRLVAEIFSANGIEVSLFSALRTTPELSFAVGHLSADVGIVLTASHNPPEYNGYKVYWNDGGQIVPPEDGEIIAEIQGLDYSAIRFDADENRITLIDKEVDEPFFEASLKNGSIGQGDRTLFSLVFTSIHGTSITAVPQVLQKAGFTNLHIVEEQAVVDPDFSTVKSPNPEDSEALSMAIQLAEHIGADLVIGTDPDSDRLGIVAREASGGLSILNGNQAMIVLTEYLLAHHKKRGLKGNEFIASTIVSTPMIAKMAAHYGVRFEQTLTGFKWIGKLIKDHPELKFIGGGEESYGYMIGDFVRDKDAVTSSLLAAEIACELKSKGLTLYDYLLDCYVKYGLYQERLISITKKGQSGSQEIEAMMKGFRSHPPIEVAGEPVAHIEDYLLQEIVDIQTGTRTPISLPKANVIVLETTTGSRIAARPSGTEPKIKFYFSVHETLHDVANYDVQKIALQERINQFVTALDLD
ncbi:MAG: phospho-sugar mutase [Flavobacteriaceae bacterium]